MAPKRATLKYMPFLSISAGQAWTARRKTVSTELNAYHTIITKHAIDCAFFGTPSRFIAAATMAIRTSGCP